MFQNLYAKLSSDFQAHGTHLKIRNKRLQILKLPVRRASRADAQNVDFFDNVSKIIRNEIKARPEIKFN